MELERELKQIEQRRLDINSRIAALRSEQEASSLGMATNLAAATLAMETPSRPSTKSGNQHFSGLVDYAASPYETELSAHVEYDSTAMVNEVHNGSPLAKSSRPMRVSKKHRSSPRTFTKAEMQLVEQALTEFKGDSVMLYKKHGPKGDGRLEGWSLLELNTQIRAERQRRTEASVDLWPFERAL